MATLVWDQIGERFYQSGIDHGVLYLQDDTVVPWNGIVEVEESTSQELKSFFLDGVKFLENLSPGDYVGKLKAVTYPDEFDRVNGIATVAPGLNYYEQPPKSFNLSYRSRIGNDIEGAEYGYKIHILYNIVANPDAYSYSTAQDSGVSPIEFSWSLTGTPVKVVGSRYRPTVHVSIDSNETPPDVLQLIEGILYGTASTNPSLPSIQEIADFFGYLGALIIVDHGDGTWSAIDEAGTYITMLNDTTFQIDDADVVYLDANTYKVSSTNVGGSS